MPVQTVNARGAAPDCLSRPWLAAWAEAHGMCDGNAGGGALISMPPLSTSRQVIHTGRAPAAVGPYSQAIRHGALVFASGQVGLDPETRTIVAGGVAAETRQALTNLTAVLESAGASPAAVLKTTVFLADMADFGVMNEIYGSWFGSEPPARSTVAVLGLPLGARVEIEAVAYAATQEEP